MPLRYYANAPATTLSASCTNVATTISVASTTGLPVSYPYTLILDRGTASEEAVSVTAAADTTLTVSRGIDSTTAFAHNSGASVAHGITAQDIREPNSHINALSGVHGVTGSVVGTTDDQTLTNKTLTSPTINNPTITGPGAIQFALKTEDQSVTTGAFPDIAWSDVTELSFQVEAGAKYVLYGLFLLAASAAGVSADVGLNGPTLTRLGVGYSGEDSATALNYDQVMARSVDSNRGRLVVGSLECSAAGTVTVRMRNGGSEGTATVQAGSMIMVTRVA